MKLTEGKLKYLSAFLLIILAISLKVPQLILPASSEKKVVGNSEELEKER